MTKTHPTPRDYFIILIALMVLLGLTVGMAFVDLDKYLPGNFWSLSVALLIAIAKAVLIILFFMHVKFGKPHVIAFASAGFLWLGIMLVLTFNDYLTRNHPSDLNYKGEPRYIMDMKK